VQQSFMQSSVVNFHFRRWVGYDAQFLVCKERSHRSMMTVSMCESISL
jgi:hypothetical protein